MTRHGRGRGQRGQAAVETAIVMPLFVFILLGLLQLGLMHQAKLLVKYAAFKAVRAGSINRADHDVMSRAAIAVLMPVITRADPLSGGGGNGQEQYGLYQVYNATKYVTAFDQVSKVVTSGGPGGGWKKVDPSKIIDVTVCHPRVSDANDKTDFDDPKNSVVTPAGASWRPFEKTKLSVQVTLYYRMFIPFANAFVWYAAFGQETADQIHTMKYVLRTKKDENKTEAREDRDKGGWTLQDLKGEAEQGNYFIPIRGSYAMRMMSNFKQGALPPTNKCRVAWEKEEN